MTMLDGCPRCSQPGVTDGVCGLCGWGYTTTTSTRSRRQGRPCRHTRWRTVGQVYVGGEQRRRDRCARCGQEREVEV